MGTTETDIVRLYVEATKDTNLSDVAKRVSVDFVRAKTDSEYCTQKLNRLNKTRSMFKGDDKIAAEVAYAQLNEYCPNLQSAQPPKPKGKGI